MALRLTKSTFSWYFPVFFVIVLAIGIVSSLYVYQSVSTSLRQSLINRTETIALALNPGDLSKLKGDESDVGSPVYENLKTKLASIHEANEDSVFVYIMGKRDGELYFVADSEDPQSEDYSPPGQVYYEDSPAFENAFDSKASGSEGPISDRWGTWITGVAPILNNAGEVVAAAGIDIDAKEFRQQVIIYTMLPLIITFILIAFVYFGMHVRRQEQELMEVKSKFIAIASHDIRSPLTGLSWATRSLLSNSKMDQDDKRMVMEISNQIQHLLVTANDILDGLSADMPNMSILKDKIKLSDVVKNSIENIKFFAGERQVEIKSAQIPEEIIIIGDQGKLQQMFINILSNAIKYSHPFNEVKVEYIAHDRLHEVRISDQGIGIPKDEQAKVFKGFHRAHNAEVLHVHGTGLGLYLVKRIAELHGGKVNLVSEEGKGTTVVVKLPRIS